MPIEFRLPQLGMGMQEGTVVEWLKAVGDPVEEDEPIVIVETAKVETELGAPVSGVLARICAPAGETISVLELLAVIAEPGETSS